MRCRVIRDRVMRAMHGRVLRRGLTHPTVLAASIGLLFVSVGSTRADAQLSNAVSQAVTRARGLLDNGKGDSARLVLDSLVTHVEAGSEDLAESLFWRAALSENTSEAARDWKRMVIDIPLSPRVPDALLRLGELDLLRGRTTEARAYLTRILLDYADAPQRVKAMIWIARSHFDDRNTVKACEATDALRAERVPEGELQLQVGELQVRCRNAATATAGEGTATAGGGTTTATAGEGTATAGVRFSVQLAAYDTRAQASALVARLAKRGIKARVDGDRKPFRVRVGRFDSRADAAAMLARLKKQGQNGFIAELTP
jgi:hypothetical protein